MKEFDNLVDIVAHLRSEDGCPWDREQTEEDFKLFLIEEAYEVFDALNSQDKESICEELGDLLIQIVVLCQLAKEKDKFSLEDVIKRVSEKLIKRHPHVFDKKHEKFKEASEVLKNWQNIKKEEKKSPGLPNYMPSTIALHILFDKIEILGKDKGTSTWGIIRSIKEKYKSTEFENFENVENIVNLILDLINLLRVKGYDAESLLREKVKQLECLVYG